LKFHRLTVFLILVFVGVTSISYSQNTIIRGKVTDANNGDALPFVNLKLKGTSVSTQTDFEGNYSIKSTGVDVDSLIVFYIGYERRAKKIKSGIQQNVNFQLKSALKSTREVVISASNENPAYRIVRAAEAARDKFKNTHLKSFDYESYNRVEVDVDNMGESFKKRKIIKKIKAVMDSIQQMAGEDGKPILPVFVSESLSKVYARNSPNLKREEIKNTRVSGIAMNDGSTISQFIGSSFQQYDFNKNYLNIVTKNFASPIGNNWKLVYEYELEDSVMVGDDYCYQLKVMPRREQDLAFTGRIWITKMEWALRRVDLRIAKEANLNFIESIKIQQEIEEVELNTWLPTKNRMTIDVAEVSGNWAGMLAKFYTSNKNYVLDDVKPVSFYEQPVEVLEGAQINEEAFWNKQRHDTLTTSEKNVYKMIDTIKSLPVVKTYVEVADILVNGYKRIGKWDYGPYLLAYAFNNIEGSRFRLGFRSRPEFSEKLILGGWAAYGTKDNIWKGEASLRYIFEKKKWTQVGILQRYDLEQLSLADNLIPSNPLFVALNRIGNIDRSRPFYQSYFRTFFLTRPFKGMETTLSFENRTFNPVSSYDFGVLRNLSDVDQAKPDLLTHFQINEVKINLRYARKEYFLQNYYRRVSVNSRVSPIFIFQYTRGFSSLTSNDNLSYHKFQFGLDHTIQAGILGTARYVIDAGYIPNTIPYPLLRSHLGNQVVIFNPNSFNLLNMFDFVSDKWVSLSYQQYFEGLLLNAIPGISKAKWRLLAQGKVLTGAMSDNNYALNLQGGSSKFNRLGSTPYIEVGYGIENILRLFRIDFVHRITYRNQERLPNQAALRNFGIFGSVQFKL